MQERAAADAASGAPVLAPHRRSLPAYVGAGGLATGLHYAITITAVELFAMGPIAASALGFAAGAVLKYWLNYSVAFQSRAPHATAAWRFAVALAILMGLNTLFFGLLQRGLGLHYLLAQALTTGLLIPPGYAIHRLWVFR